MGLLVNGVWQDQWYNTKKSGGHFVRQDSIFRNWISADGSTGFKAEPGRYHLYVAHACPWAHRTLIFRKLKKLEDLIDISIVHPFMGEQGWTFDACDACIPDTVNHKHYLYEIYALAKPDYTGRVTVPTLWDKQKNTIASNESSEIIRMFNSEFSAFTDVETDFYPEELRPDIDEVSEIIYHTVNNGVYKCGFATTQEAYEESFYALFNTLDMIEKRLGEHRYLTGNRLTEADWRLFPTLVRFDAVYYGHFKCNLRRIIDYPNLSNYLRELYQYPGIAETFNLQLTKMHYYQSHESVNPTRIVPVGPKIDLNAPHDRDRFSN